MLLAIRRRLKYINLNCLLTYSSPSPAALPSISQRQNSDILSFPAAIPAVQQLRPSHLRSGSRLSPRGASRMHRPAADVRRPDVGREDSSRIEGTQEASLFFRVSPMQGPSRKWAGRYSCPKEGSFFALAKQAHLEAFKSTREVSNRRVKRRPHMWSSSNLHQAG